MGAGVQLGGAAGLTRHGHLWGQRGLPSVQPARPPPGLAAGKPPHPRRRGGHRERPAFLDCYTELQLHQGLPGLPRPGLALAGGWRGADQSRMYVRHLFDSRLMFFSVGVSTGDQHLTSLARLTLFSSANPNLPVNSTVKKRPLFLFFCKEDFIDSDSPGN